MLGDNAQVPICPSPYLHWERTQAIAVIIRRIATSSLLVLNRVQDILVYLVMTEIGLFSFFETANKMEDEIKVNQSHYKPEVPRRFQEVKVPRLRDNGPGW